MRATRPALLALLAVLAVVCAGPVQARAPAVLAATPIDRLDLAWWKQRFQEKQAAIRGGRYDVVYYGDSITQNFERRGPQPQADWAGVWQRFYGDRRALNLGFKGDTTASLLWRVQHGQGDVRGPDGAPKVAILLIGANNLGRLHWSAADTEAGIVADVDAIRAHLPHTRVLLLGILPSIRSDWATQTTIAVNAALARRYAGGGGVVFVDAGRTLLRDGRADPALFIDPLLVPPEPPLHPTAEGAARVARAIEPALAGMLGDSAHR